MHAARPTPSNSIAVDPSRQLQRKLYLAAKKSKNRRFHALYDRIFRLDILWRAWREVKANGGCAGADGVTLEMVEQQGVDSYLQPLAAELKAGSYRPQPVKRVYIPKPDGRQRPLGISSVRDRIVQQATKIVIEPLFEADFLDVSYGFRPQRSAHQAVQAVKTAMVRGWWAVEVDILGYFDAIPHDRLMRLVGRRISDRRVKKLLQLWLQAGVLESGQVSSTEVGSPQGSNVSPLLANLYLHVLDQYWTHHHASLGTLVRYADDMVLICRRKAEAEQALTIVKQLLEKLDLQPHPAKTRLVDLEQEGFDFLGFHFHKMRGWKTGKLAPYIWPTTKAMNAIRSRIRQLTDRHWLKIPLSDVIAHLNPVIRGWRNYFRMGNATKQFQQLDRFVERRLWIQASARKRHRRDLRWPEFMAWLRASGITYFYPYGDLRKRTLKASG